MADEAEVTVDEAGIQRTETGDLAQPVAKTEAERAAPDTKTTEAKPDAKPEAKPDAKAAPDGSLLGKDKKVEPQGAPEKYEAFKLPEGFEANEEIMTEAQGLFKKLNLPQAAAQELVDFYSKQSQQASQSVFDFVAEQNQKWVNEVINDKDLGDGKGLRPEVKEDIGKVFALLGPAEAAFREAMDFTGAGNNPAIIRGLKTLAGLLNEGKHVPGGGPSKLGQAANGRDTRPSAASALYPNLPSQTS